MRVVVCSVKKKIYQVLEEREIGREACIVRHYYLEPLKRRLIRPERC